MQIQFTPTVILIILVIVLITAVVTIALYSINVYIRDINNKILTDVRQIERHILSNLTDHMQITNDTRDLLVESLHNKENITNNAAQIQQNEQNITTK